MIKPEPFWKIMQPLSDYCRGFKAEEKDIYYDHLKNSFESDLQKAVDLIVETHDSKYWPTIKEIKQVLSEIAQGKSWATLEELNRRVCPNNCTRDGFLLVTSPEGYTTAVPCDCEKGRRRRAYLNAYFKREGMKYVVNQKREERLPYREPGDDSDAPF